MCIKYISFQDLYKNENKISSQREDVDDSDDNDSSDSNELGFHLSLDEETQFSQPLLDTQGYRILLFYGL